MCPALLVPQLPTSWQTALWLPTSRVSDLGKEFHLTCKITVMLVSFGGVQWGLNEVVLKQLLDHFYAVGMYIIVIIN